ncbi:MAG: hypothetical protein K5979_11265 [Ruminococcus sp.]|nr:hypothetical protein [Ruminococcus sp.]
MRYIKILAYLASADILSLFVCISLAPFSGTFMRVISALCSTGIMICMLIAAAEKTAENDVKYCRREKKKISFACMTAMGTTASAVPFISWLILRLTADGKINFYTCHKLINGWFLPVYRYINPDAYAKNLTDTQIWLMLPLSFVPAIVFIIAYRFALKKNNTT